MRAFAPLFFLAPLLACFDAGQGGAWAGTFQDSAGVVIVRNPDQGIWAEGEGWRLVEELRLGAVAGNPDYQFGQVGTIALDSRGEIYVSDIQAQHIRVFSPEGGYLRTVGRPGSGPGELALGATALLMTTGDTLLVPDARNRRINRFAPDGSSLPSSPLDPERQRTLRFNWKGIGYAAAQLRPVGVPAATGGTDAIVVVEPSGLMGDTLLRFPSGGLFQGPGIHYFTPEPIWNLTDSLTVIYGVNNAYRVGLYDGTGSLLRVVTRPLEPAPITDRDIRAFFAYLDRAWLDAGVAPSRLAANHARVHFADNLPVFSSVHQGPRGSLWVQRVQAPGLLTDEEIELYNFVEDFGASGWDVFDAEGRYLGIVEMPPRFQPRVFLGDKIYGVWRDELDVQYVMRLRVVEGEGPLHNPDRRDLRDPRP